MAQTIDQNPPQSVGRTCRHPTDAARWDEHRALLRCTSCGRKIEAPSEQGSSRAQDTTSPGLSYPTQPEGLNPT